MMKNPRAAVTICICGMLLVPSLAHGLGARQEQAVQPEGLRIVVIEGEDSVNIIGQGTAVATVVEVRDRNDLPVSGASVVFLLGEGGTATLNAGLSQVTLTTNALGQAAVTVNPVASGAVQLSVNATFQGAGGGNDDRADQRGFGGGGGRRRGRCGGRDRRCGGRRGGGRRGGRGAGYRRHRGHRRRCGGRGAGCPAGGCRRRLVSVRPGGVGSVGGVGAEFDGRRRPVGGELECAVGQRCGDRRLRRAVSAGRRQLDRCFPTR